jgi:hypothetical protein
MNFKNQPIRNKNCLWWPCLLKDRDEMSNLYRGPSIDASYQLSDNLEKWFQRRSANQNKNCLWQPCLLMDRGKMINHYREPLIDASYLVSVHLAEWLQRRIILKISQSETRIACGGHVCLRIDT